MPGDSIAANLFRAVYQHVVSRWIHCLTEMYGENLLSVINPLDGNDVNLSATAYADDVRRTTDPVSAARSPSQSAKFSRASYTML